MNNSNKHNHELYQSEETEFVQKKLSLEHGVKIFKQSRFNFSFIKYTQDTLVWSSTIREPNGYQGYFFTLAGPQMSLGIREKGLDGLYGCGKKVFRVCFEMTNITTRIDRSKIELTHK